MDAIRTLRVCPQCGCENRAEAPLAYSEAPWRLKGCRDCGFVYLENAPSYEELQADFNWTDTKDSEREQRRRLEPRLMAFETRFRAWRKKTFGPRDKGQQLLARYVTAGRFLDIGCGNGRSFRRCRKGLTGFGVEIDPRAVANAQPWAEATGGDVVLSDALHGMHQFADDFFDGVLMRAYLEHEIEPRSVLAAARRVLRPGGRLIIQVPNYGSFNRRLRGRRWCGFRHPDHVNYFTPATLSRMVHDAGYTIIRFRFDDRLTLSDRMWMTAEVPND